MARPPPRPIEERHWPELYGRSLPPPPDAAHVHVPEGRRPPGAWRRGENRLVRSCFRTLGRYLQGTGSACGKVCGLHEVMG